MDATDRAPTRDAGTHARRTPNETQYKYKFGHRFRWNLRLGSRRGHTRGGSHSIRSSSPLHEGGAGGQSSHTLHRCVENKGRGVAKGSRKKEHGLKEQEKDVRLDSSSAHCSQQLFQMMKGARGRSHSMMNSLLERRGDIPPIAHMW